MTDAPAASGADLARQALAAARAAAKTRPAGPDKKTRRTTRTVRTGGRDPQGLGAILEHLTAEQGWSDSVTGGNLLDQWPTIAPTELATAVQPIAYDPDRGLLTLRPSTPAHATQIRLFQQQLAKHLNTALGRPAVRAIRVLPPGAVSSAADTRPAPAAVRPTEAPVKTRETAHPGYRATLEAALSHRLVREPADPYLLEAIAEQDRALRAKRLPDTEHTEYLAERDRLERLAGPEPGSVEASRAAALAYKRAEAAGLTQPRRAFDVA
jgi:predicted nucleic acid-binding Zn ribbon protein